jgi:ribosomal protein S18 acetylase RimI-like enzyme
MRIEPLATHHDRRSFTCGDNLLDDYLQRFARQHAKTNLSRTYVAAEGSVVVGFYTLAMAAILNDQLPAVHGARFPRFPLPVARLARLAVDQSRQGQGLGERLLMDALQRCARLADDIGMIGVIVDAKHERARQWYERYEFERFPDAPLTLWLPIAVIKQL